MRSIGFQVVHLRSTVHPSPASRREAGTVSGATSGETLHARQGLLDIEVDGIRLIERLRRAELPHALAEQEQEAGDVPSGSAASLAGDYMPLGAGFGWPHRHFLGKPRGLPRGGKEGETTLLECTCGDEDCSALMARITMTPRTVTWSDFRTTFRDWDLGALGSITFSRPQYEKSLRTAAVTQQASSSATPGRIG